MRFEKRLKRESENDQDDVELNENCRMIDDNSNKSRCRARRESRCSDAEFTKIEDALNSLYEIMMLMKINQFVKTARSD